MPKFFGLITKGATFAYLVDGEDVDIAGASAASAVGATDVFLVDVGAAGTIDSNAKVTGAHIQTFVIGGSDAANNGKLLIGGENPAIQALSMSDGMAQALNDGAISLAVRLKTSGGLLFDTGEIYIDGANMPSGMDIDNPDIDGGTINSTNIGVTTAAVARFTSLYLLEGMGGGPNNNLRLRWLESDSADRDLDIKVVGADRVLTLGADLYMEADLTISAATSILEPLTVTVECDIDQSLATGDDVQFQDIRARDLRLDRSVYFSQLYDNATSGTNVTTTIDWAVKGNKQKLSLNHNQAAGTIAFTNPGGQTSLTLLVTYAAAYSVGTWDADILWPGGATGPQLSSATGAKDIISFFFDGTNYYGTIVRGFG